MNDGACWSTDHVCSWRWHCFKICKVWASAWESHWINWWTIQESVWIGPLWSMQKSFQSPGPKPPCWPFLLSTHAHSICQTGKWALSYGVAFCFRFHMAWLLVAVVFLAHAFLRGTFFIFTRGKASMRSQFCTKQAANALRDKPCALISDYVTVKRTGRGCRLGLSMPSFFCTATSYWLFFALRLVIGCLSVKQENFHKQKLNCVEWRQAVC